MSKRYKLRQDSVPVCLMYHGKLPDEWGVPRDGAPLSGIGSRCILHVCLYECYRSRVSAHRKSKTASVCFQYDDWAIPVSLDELAVCPSMGRRRTCNPRPSSLVLMHRWLKSISCADENIDFIMAAQSTNLSVANIAVVQDTHLLALCGTDISRRKRPQSGAIIFDILEQQLFVAMP